MARKINRLGTLLLLAPLATACRTVIPVPAPAQFVSTKTPGLVWVTKTDNSVVALGSPKLIGDTLAGFVPGGDYVEMPLSSVQSMRARVAAKGHTMLLIGSIVAAGAVATAVVVRGASSGPQNNGYCNEPGAEC